MGSTAGKWTIRVVALGYLLIVLLGPLGMMIFRTLQDWDAAWAAITNHATIEAFKLTLLVTAIAVPVNTVFGIICGLVIVRILYKDFGTVAHLDWPMTFTAIALAIVSSMLAGLYPTWRACQIAPAAQLKTQ